MHLLVRFFISYIFISNLRFFFLMIRLPPSSTLFPYTTLFRSQVFLRAVAERVAQERDTRRAVRAIRSEEHTSELQSLRHLVCRLLLEKKKLQYLFERRLFVTQPGKLD